jgi:catechol 2,3-dioxygenase-like lactoylglutathione lyase family enzyme
LFTLPIAAKRPLMPRLEPDLDARRVALPATAQTQLELRMIGYVTIGTNDLEKARAFYDQLMPEFGASALSVQPNRTFYGTGMDRPFLAVTQPFDGEPATFGNGTMVALPAGTRADVDRIHAKALELGAVDEGAPGFRFDPGQGLYFAYFRDPDGNKLAVFKIGRE